MSVFFVVRRCFLFLLYERAGNLEIGLDRKIHNCDAYIASAQAVVFLSIRVN